MTYNEFTPNGGLGAPGTGYGSRGKGGHIKHLSVGPQGYNNQSYEEQFDAAPTPRTSRSHLLAGLRTAPKSAPLSQYGQPSNRYSYHGDSAYGNQYNLGYGQELPQSAMGPSFGGLATNNKVNNRRSQMYSMPEQVLAPPALDFNGSGGEQIDPQAFGDLVATKAWLIKRQQQLQQQLIDVTAAAQQFQGMNINNGQQHYQGAQLAPQSSVYNQQAQSGMQPQIQAVPNQPGVFSVYNPMTGQYSCFVDQNMQQIQLQSSPPLTNPGISSSPSEDDGFGQLRNDTRSPAGYSAGQSRNATPPKHTPSPSQDVAPLPPPSANAFRPGHKKTASLAGSGAFSKLNGSEGGRLGAARAAGLPNTPLSGTFGPGMGRVGEHPSRQPRGPPPLEELVAAPTSKSEGSKNFATRQRRRAVINLVRAGNERRVGTVRSNSGDSF